MKLDGLIYFVVVPGNRLTHTHTNILPWARKFVNQYIEWFIEKNKDSMNQ
jgi:hypothetical protein